MLDMKYIGNSETYKVKFKEISSNVVEMIGDFLVRTDGFFLSRPDFEDTWDYSEYTTIYREIENGAQFSNDGSVYTEPEIPNVAIESVELTEEELKEIEQRRLEEQAALTNAELSEAIMELAENISDIEDAVAELGALMA